MKTIVNRLKDYIKYKGLKTSVVEAIIGVSNGTLSKPFKDDKTIKTDTLEKFLRKYIDINPAWLLTGDGEMINNQSGNDDSKKEGNITWHKGGIRKKKEMPSNESCPLCEEKDEVIFSQQKTIATLDKLVAQMEARLSANEKGGK